MPIEAEKTVKDAVSGTEQVGLIVKEAEAVTVAERYRSRLLMFFMVAALIPAVGYGLRDVLGHSSFVVNAWTNLVSGLVLLANLFAYVKFRRFAFAEMVFRLSVFVLLGFNVALGGQGGTGLYWVFLYPVFTFAILERRGATISTAIFYVFLAGVNVAGFLGLYSPFYSTAQLTDMWALLIVLAVVGYVKETQRKSAFGEIVGARERLLVLLESLPAGVVLFDGSGAPIAANPAAVTLLGRPLHAHVSAKDYVTAYGFSKETGAPYPVDEFPLVAALSRGAASIKDDVFVHRPDGTRIVLRFAAAPVRGERGDVVSAVAVFEDATKEHEIDQMKSEFVSLASHQLKTPLTGIKWSVETLLGGDSGPLTAEQKAHVGQIDATVERLSRLVADLLNVSRIETGRKFDIVRKPVDVVPMIREVAKDAEAAGRKRGVTILMPTLPPTLVLDVDVSKMREVFANLAGNAVKYSKEGGVVEIGVGPQDAGRAVLFVKDSGLGIPRAQQSRVFEKFFRAENVAVDIEGTGLGLYIVKAIVEKHDGRVWFESAEGKGTTFFVSVPFAAKE